MSTGILVDKILNEFFVTVKEKMPCGSIKRGFPITIGKAKLSVVIFSPDYSEKNTVSFGLFIFRKRYSRRTLIVRESGIVTEKEGTTVIPHSDLTPHEPDFSSLANKEIAYLVAIQLKALGYEKYAKISTVNALESTGQKLLGD